MSPIDHILDALGACGCKPKQRGKQWYAKCPVHGGNDFDSLSLTEGGDGRVLVTCHSQGCPFGAVMHALGLEPQDAWPRSADIGGVVVPLRRCPTETPQEPDVVYDYVDEHGELLYQVCRYVTPEGKTFRQRRPDGAGGWIWSLGDTRRVLYRLPAVLAAVKAGELVYVVEGEKDVETLGSLGLVATCNMGGACDKPEKWRPEWSECLRGAQVVILPDNDEPGRLHATNVRASLTGAKTVRVVELPGLLPKGDVSDWIEAGGTRDQLVRLCQIRRLVTVEFGELLTRDLPPKRTLLHPWLYSQDLVMVYANRGVGKTMFLLELTLGLASGGQVFTWHCPEPVRVLYVDGEMPAVTMQERIAAAIAGRNGRIRIQPLLVTPDLQPAGIRRLSTVEGRQDLLDLVDPDTTVLILDNLSCLYGGAENDAEGWDEMQAFLLSLRTRGVTAIIVHHSGKSGQQRGTSRREDVLDTVVKLSRPQDYRPDEGARMMIEFEKARNLNGTEIESLDVKLVDMPDGSHEWSFMSGEESALRQVADLTRLGMTQRQIAAEMNISNSTACRWVSRAKARGLL